MFVEFTMGTDQIVNSRAALPNTTAAIQRAPYSNELFQFYSSGDIGSHILAAAAMYEVVVAR